MDVNGTRFHLLQEKTKDWGECFPDGSEQSLNAAWNTAPSSVDVTYDDSGALRLRQLTTVFRRFARRSDSTLDYVDLENRRGAARDRYGNIYWIDDAATGILFQAACTDQAVQFWTSVVSKTDPPAGNSFHPLPSVPPPPLYLRGLTITTQHYLVVGYMELTAETVNKPRRKIEPGDVQKSGLLIFDLHQSALPDRRIWPQMSAGQMFMPRDMSPSADGGVYILDTSPQHRRFWVLDKRFRVEVDVRLHTPERFHPVGSQLTPQIESITARGETDLTSTTSNPVSIDTGPDGRILILEQGNGDEPILEGISNKFPPAVVVYREDPDNPGIYIKKQRLILRVSIQDDRLEQDRIVGVVGNDFVYDAAKSRLYVADREGNQVIAFYVDWANLTAPDVLLDGASDYIPLRRWGGRALIHSGDRVYYDSADRWIAAQPFDSCEFARRAVILTPTEFEIGQTFDSTILGCVWHRLLLDAEIPVGTTVSFRARAADDQDLLGFMPWEEQPLPYLRRKGAELPFYRHPKLPDPATKNADSTPAGTWELLFQNVRGRYMQLEITLEGTGRSTPLIYALRAWFPRFSYLEHYLPAIYRENIQQANFLDRWLANFEGIFTNLEDKIQNLPRLLDARSAPTEALDWLGKWLGLILDPLWNDRQRRFFIRHISEFYKWRGTTRGLEMTLRLYLETGLDEATFWSDACFSRYLRVEESCIRRGLPGYEQYESFAHRFRILVPDDLTDDEVIMIERIANLEKPAHTLFELQASINQFIIGEALLGLDTRLGFNRREPSGPIYLGISRLPDGYLSPPYPLDVMDRLVMERDQLGDLPEL